MGGTFGRRLALGAAWTATALLGWVTVYVVAQGKLGEDCHAYWLTGHRPDLYTAAPTAHDAYLYSPAFAQAIRPLTWLPWPAFAAVWIGAEALLLGWLVWPLPLRWRVPMFALCLPELWLGNVHALFALVLVCGFTRPGLWAVPLLTKVTPAVGLAWFAARREWRHLGWALGWTAAVVAVSFAFDPSAWLDWARFLAHNTNGGHRSNPVWTVIHYSAAVALLGYAIRTGRRSLLVLVVVLAAPVATYLAPLATLAALPRLLAAERETERAPVVAEPVLVAV